MVSLKSQNNRLWGIQKDTMFTISIDSSINKSIKKYLDQIDNSSQYQVERDYKIVKLNTSSNFAFNTNDYLKMENSIVISSNCNTIQITSNLIEIEGKENQKSLVHIAEIVCIDTPAHYMSNRVITNHIFVLANV